MMRRIIVATAFIVAAAGGAQADEWCGYAAKANAMIECGYSTVADCESDIGKGAMCFIDPDVAANVRRASPTKPAPAISLPAGAGRG
jgi:hypothetical protein